MAPDGETPPPTALERAVSAAAEQSVVLGALAAGRDALTGGLSSLRAGFERGYETSGIRQFGRWSLATTRRSYCYRWLTAEPEPAVVVIDLRETWTVGPVIRLGERLASTGPVRRATTTAMAAGRTTEHLWLRAPVRVASALVLLVAVPWLVLTWGGRGTLGTVLGLAVIGASVLGLRVDATWQDLAESRLGELLVAVFEPPPPPDERDEKSP